MKSFSRKLGGQVARHHLAVRTGMAVALAGAASSAVIAGETITYTYDAQGRLVVAQSSGTVNNNQTHSYCYDAAGNRTLAKADSAGAIASCTSSPTPTPTPAPSISIGDGGAMEGGSVAFTVSLSASYGSSISVNYATAYGTAGSYDFYATSGVMTFAAGQTSQTIWISTKQDGAMEADETFTVNLTSPTGGATISDGQGVGTIFDDDDEPMCGQVLC